MCEKAFLSHRDPTQPKGAGRDRHKEPIRDWHTCELAFTEFGPLTKAEARARDFDSKSL